MNRSELPSGVALLIAAGRLSLHPSQPPSPIAASEKDWLASPEAAQRHGMSAWLSAALAQWPQAHPRVRDEVAIAARAQVGRALQGTAELSTIISLLRGAGIEAVALKGPLFSRWLYGELGSRRFGDLDLLLQARQRARAVEALRTAGYRLAGGISEAAAAVIYSGVGAWPLVRKDACPLDLHWRPQTLLFQSPLDSAEVLRDSILVQTAGCDVRIPSPTHATALTLVHAAKHLWSSLELVLSIAHLMRRDDVDWPRVRALTSEAEAWTGAAAGLRIAGKIFECDLPGSLRGLPASRATRQLEGAARTALAMPDVANTPRAVEFRAHRASLDTVRSRIRYTAWRLLAPTPVEWSWCRLPDRLALLYVPLRIIRLSLVGVRSALSLGPRSRKPEA